MSYILDALKKSDQERKRGDVPGLQTVHIPMATEQATPWVLYAVVALLFVLLAFMVGMMVSDKRQSGPDLSTVADNSSVQVQAPPANKPDRPVQENIVERAKPQKKTVSVAQTAQLAPQNKAEPVNTLPEVRAAVIADVSVQDLIEIPYLHELPDYQQQSIPEMNFAGHVYSSSPSNRSIIINNNAMSEGDSIIEGLNVEQITSNGVVFSFQGELFKMDILQDWSFE